MKRVTLEIGRVIFSLLVGIAVGGEKIPIVILFTLVALLATFTVADPRSV